MRRPHCTTGDMDLEDLGGPARRPAPVNPRSRNAPGRAAADGEAEVPPAASGAIAMAGIDIVAEEDGSVVSDGNMVAQMAAIGYTGGRLAGDLGGAAPQQAAQGHRLHGDGAPRAPRSREEMEAAQAAARGSRPAVGGEEMTPAQKRATRKAAAPPALDLTMQLRDLMAGHFEGMTGASQAAQACSIVEAKADVLATDSEDGGGGRNALMFVVQRAADPDLITRLVRAGADVNASNMLGFTVMHSFASRTSKDAATPIILGELLSAGCQPLVPLQALNGLSPLHVAAGFLDAELCSMLIRARANPSAKGPGGATPLDWAQKRKPDFRQLLALECALKP